MTNESAQPIVLPPVTQANVSVSSPEGVHVTVTTQTPQLWFKMLRSIVLDGTWARLLDRHRCVLIVMLEARDEEGSAYLPRESYIDREGIRRPGLYELTGLKRTALSQAIDDLCRDPSALGHLADPGYPSSAAGLLARDGPDRYHVLPGRVFAGRRPSPVASGLPPGRHFCRSDDTIDRPRGRFAAGTADAAFSHRETRARSNSEEDNSSSKSAGATTTNLAGQELEEAIALLTQGCPAHRHRGFPEADARKVLSESGATLAKVRMAVANTNHKASRKTTDGKPGIRNWRGYVRTQLLGECSLFPAMERDQDNAVRVHHRLARCATAFGDETSCRVVNEYFTDGRGGGHVGRLVQLMRDRAWAGDDDEALWGAAYRAAVMARD